jgi:excisionase family DNA binding protein
MDSALLRTGEVAQICGVTPDAVLKWIKKGRLPAARTPGGHYRVSRDTVFELGLAGPDQPESDSAAEAQGERHGTAARCWEYFGHQGVPRDSCRSCVVYLARAQNCYHLAGLGEQHGHKRQFCQTECADCSFYRASHRMATAVLVITQDEGLVRRVGKETDASRVFLRFARSGYESSMVVEQFRPAMVVLDSDLPEVREGPLPDSILHDGRIPGVRIFVACRDGHQEAIDELGLPTITAPFSASQLEQLAERVVHDASAAPRDVA